VNFDERGLFHADNIQSPNLRENLRYEWRGYRTPAKGWRFEQERMEALDADDRIVHPESTAKLPMVKRYLRETETWAPSSVFYTDRRGGSNRLTALMDAEVFDNPKDPDVLEWVVSSITSGEDLVLDFFAGSGTTGQAVWQANANDGGRRRWLLVQEPAPCNPAQTTGQAALDAGYATIVDVTAERLRRASAEQPEGIDGGFRLFRTAVTNLNLLTPIDIEEGEGERYVQESIRTALEPPVRDGAADEDLLWEVLLKATDLPLTSTPEVILDDPTVWRVDADGTRRILVSFGEPSIDQLDELDLDSSDVIVLRSDRVGDGLTMTLAARCRVVLIDQVSGEVSV
jgi:adenine-specific DNA-methyltransferase